jgi:hypothetical protein
MLVEKPSTRSVAKKSTKHKGKVEAGPLEKTNIPVDNTRKVAVRTQASEKWLEWIKRLRRNPWGTLTILR